MSINRIKNNEFQVDLIDGITVVKSNLLRVTLNEAKILKQTLDSLITANHYRIVIDLTDTHFIDSATSGVLLNAMRSVKKLNGDILTITPHKNINNLFNQTRLSKIFKQYNTTEQALAFYSAL